MAIRRVIGSGGGGVAYSTGGATVNVIPKNDGAGGLKDSALTDNATQVISTEPIRVPLGAVGADAIQFNAASTGFYSTGANNVSFDAAGLRFDMSPVGIRFGAGMGGAIAAGGNVTVPDVFLGRRAAANWGLGQADVNGAPVAQTISVQNAITGSNLPAANTTIDLGLGTGTGLTGTFVVRGGDSSVATGTTAQTNIVRCVLNATKALTTGAATTLVSIPLATLQMTGGYISVYMEATDGTNQATRSEEIYYAGENSAGVFVVSTGVVGTGVTACTAAKTLTATYALTGANPALLQVTPTLTGITATRFTCVYELHHFGNTQPTV